MVDSQDAEKADRADLGGKEGKDFVKDTRDGFEAMLEGEADIQDELATQVELERARFQHELELHEEDLANQARDDLMNWEILHASYQQSWDDLVLWDAMNNAPPPPKRQRLILHVHLRGDSDDQRKLQFLARTNQLVSMSVVWTLADGEPYSGDAG